LKVIKSIVVVLLLVTWPYRTGDAGFPRDPEGTSERVRGGPLRVGLVEASPWVVRESGAPGGIEGDLVRKLAEELGAKPEWRWGGEQAHMEALERFELDLVIGGITKRTPWKKTVGLTDSYYQKHVWATAPGENAWIKLLDEFLSRRREEIAKIVEEQHAK
jgi:polar amino acid transport system substrate-binding protein